MWNENPNNDVEIKRKKLDKKKSLICFVGAPWTLIIYMLNLKKGKNKIDLEKINKKQTKISTLEMQNV